MASSCVRSTSRSSKGTAALALAKRPNDEMVSLHFVVNNKSKERLFVVDYARIHKDKVPGAAHANAKVGEADSNKLVISRLVMSSQKNMELFEALKKALLLDAQLTKQRDSNAKAK